MIEITRGNLLRADAEALVNTVNCVGYMGKGIALQFKQAHPDDFKAYARACGAGEVKPGRMFIHETGLLMNPKYIINFPRSGTGAARAESRTSRPVLRRSRRTSSASVSDPSPCRRAGAATAALTGASSVR